MTLCIFFIKARRRHHSSSSLCLCLCLKVNGSPSSISSCDRNISRYLPKKRRYTARLRTILSWLGRTGVVARSCCASCVPLLPRKDAVSAVRNVHTHFRRGASSTPITTKLIALRRDGCNGCMPRSVQEGSLKERYSVFAKKKMETTR